MEDDIAFEVPCQEGNELLRIQFSLFQDTAWYISFELFR